jgi:nitroimidazol reductase NimA-like FMN-containing flavoprotein (pyridoxamine 5'-phosphate oxidase superfamily)
MVGRLGGAPENGPIDFEKLALSMGPLANYDPNMSTRSAIRRHAERGVSDRAASILAEGHVAHVAFVEDGQPFVIPMGYHFDPETPDRLYVHGAQDSRIIKVLGSGEPVSIGVTLVDGLVYSKTAFNHSMNYRSVVVFGRGRALEDHEEMKRLYRSMIARYFPGRTAERDYSEPTGPQLDATRLVAVEIEERSAKMREGGPLGPSDANPETPGTCGVVPV